MTIRTAVLRSAPLAAALALAACGSEPAPQPLPPPPAAPKPVAAPSPSADWRDWPLAAGRWRYVPGTGVSSARYGDGAAATFVIQCDVASRRVTLMRAGTTTELRIVTSSREARLPAGHITDRGAPMSGVVLNATDTLLDAMAFSRGRIAVTSPGLDSLALPAWAEPARVVEDCRK